MGADRAAPLLPALLLGGALLLVPWTGGAAAQEAGGEGAADTASASDTVSARDTVPARDTAAVGDTAAAADAPAPPDTSAGVTYRREVFEYPTGGRADPFRPLELGQGVGPRFENLVLGGIIHAPEIGSVVILRDRTTGSRHRVRDGERIGNAQVVEIRPDVVVFSVRGATGPRREILPAESEREENQP